MANIQNNHTSPLTVGTVVIAPNTYAAVPNWDAVKKTSAIKRFLEVKALVEVAGGVSTDSGLPGTSGLPGLPDPELAEKEQIIGELRALGVEKTTRTSLENLREELVKAKAAAK